VLRLRVEKWRVLSRKWTGQQLKIAILADLPLGEPYVGLNRLRKIVKRTISLGAEVILIFGDLNISHRFIKKKISVVGSAKELGNLTAPLGVLVELGSAL
jgi:predicted MPP superfamily phosphohydrolase